MPGVEMPWLPHPMPPHMGKPLFLSFPNCKQEAVPSYLELLVWTDRQHDLTCSLSGDFKEPLSPACEPPNTSV